MINHNNFLELYQQTFGQLSNSQREGFDTLLGFFDSDPAMKDLRWVAYCLATVKHECGNEWRPIKEYGRGKGRKYGVPEANGKIYYGRGYVQLTWAGNYNNMSKLCGVDLYQDPDKALEPAVAYQIMSYGMRHGSFTGVGLKKYFNDEECNWTSARRIINGLDQAERIAGYGIQIYELLKATKETEI